MWHSFSETLYITKQVAQVNLGRDLVRQYFENDSFQQIAKAINDCKILYEGDGGEFEWQELNEFLGFLMS